MPTESGESNRFILIHVQREADRLIRMRSGATFLCIADKTKEIKSDDLRNLEYSKNVRRYEDEIHPFAQLKDLDLDLIDSYRETIGAENISPEQLLKQNDKAIGRI